MILFSLALCRAGMADTMPTGASQDLMAGVGARANGLGGAFVSLADDVTSGYWNPAGLTRMGVYSTEIGSMYSILTLDRAMDYLSIAQHVENIGNFGGSLTHFGVGGIEAFDSVGNPQGDFRDDEYLVSASYATPFTYLLRWGVSVKGIVQNLGSDHALGFGEDFGVLYQPSLSSDFTCGLNLQDAVGHLYWSTGWQDPVISNLKVGVSDKYLNQRLIVAADGDLPLEQASSYLTPHLGMELWFLPDLAGRMGLNNRDFTAGATWKYEFYEFDYAYTYNQRGLGDTHQLSMLLLFE